MTRMSGRTFALISLKSIIMKHICRFNTQKYEKIYIFPYF